MDLDASSQNGAPHTIDDSASTSEAHSVEPGSTGSSSTSSKRNVSTGLLSRISFLRSNADLRSQAGGDGTSKDVIPTTTKGSSKTNETRKQRSRRGSLRKAALLSLGKTRSDKEKESQAANADKQETAPDEDQAQTYADEQPQSPDSDDYPTPRASVEADDGSRKFKIDYHESTTSEESLPLPNITRASRQKDISTTDEDDVALNTETLQIPGHTSSSAGSARDSYSPVEQILSRRRTSRARSPLSATPIEQTPVIEEWDYSETEWWGWVILVVTWAVFVMGIGSSFEVWSWAWAVGKTPYAPPELQDDPTLPIVGYYPALIILTGVMAWIWVFTAWVGMKYFRHAKIS